MVEIFANHWLRDVIEESRARALCFRGSNGHARGPALLDTIYSWKSGDFPRMLQALREFHGTKVMISCTDRSPLEKTLKQALSLAELVIMVPAPLWVSCRNAGAARYAEFNYDGIELADRCHVAAGFVHNLSSLLIDACDAFVEGAVTFLPVLGESLECWSHPELALPQPPRADGANREAVSAISGLCSERLAAERLGAMHLNTATFEQPVLGDLTIGRPARNGRWQRSLVEVQVPDFSRLPLDEILRLRHAPEWQQWSRAVAAAMRGSHNGQEAALASLPRQAMEELPLTTFVVGSGGPHGGPAAVDFLLEGGCLGDLVRLLTRAGGVHLPIKQDSLLAGTGEAVNRPPRQSRTAFT